MWDGFIGKQIRRANRNLLIANLSLLLCVGALAGANAKYLNDWFRGPIAVDPAKIASLQSPDDMDRAFVTLDVRAMIETGTQEFKTDDAGKATDVAADFQLVPCGGRALLVRTPPGAKGTHLSGQLVEAPKEALDGVRKQLPQEYQASLLPFMLNTKGYRENGYWLLVLCVPLLLLGLWNVGRWWQRSRDMATHPIAKQLGGMQGMAQWGTELESEMNGGGRKFGKATLTPHWILVPEPFGARIARLDNLAWIFKKVTKHSVNFIPTGKTYELVMWTTQGTMLRAPAKDEQVDHLMVAIAEREPWIVVGFSADLERVWKKDRAGFLAALEQRRREQKSA